MTENETQKGTMERRILDAALATIAQYKISGARMRQIAKRAEMSQGNLHYYFPSKAELYIALLDGMLETFVEEREQALSDRRLSLPDRLACFLKQKKDVLLNRRDYMYVYYDFWVQGTRDPEIGAMMRKMYARWRDDIEKVIAEGVELGLIDPARAAIIPVLMISLMEGAALQYLVDADAFDMDTYFDAAHDMLLQLIQPSSKEAVELETID